MRPIDKSEILALGPYEEIRERFRNRVIQLKRLRRVQVGEHISIVFENRDTVLLQIQEMVRTERITNAQGIAHEIETYNELIPDDGQLSFTLFIEIADKPLRDKMLVELADVEKSVFIEVDGERLPATGNRTGAVEGRTTAVHYLKVALTQEAQQAIRAKTSLVAIVIDHPAYKVRTSLGTETIAELAMDLD